jgi:anti-sigma B factor antagonist
MACEIEQKDGLIRLRGEMTIYAAIELARQLFDCIEGKKRRCQIDLSEVSEIDTAGLQVLLMAKRACEARKTAFALVSPSPAVAECFKLLRMSETPAKTPRRARRSS